MSISGDELVGPEDVMVVVERVDGGSVEKDAPICAGALTNDTGASTWVATVGEPHPQTRPSANK
jgi:hypothetical protein